MRLPSPRNRRSSLDNETMTPMIDVVFLLLVFFVCASVGQMPDLLLPAVLSAGATAAEQQIANDEQIWEHQQVRIHVAPADGTTPGGEPVVRLNERPLNGIDELSLRLKSLAVADPMSLVILDIDDQVSVQQFIAVYDLCQSLKFQRIAFATRIPERYD